MARKKIEKTETEVMVEYLTLVSNWKTQLLEFERNAKWKQFNSLKDEILNRLVPMYHETSRRLSILSRAILYRTMKEWIGFCTESNSWDLYEFTIEKADYMMGI